MRIARWFTASLLLLATTIVTAEEKSQKIPGLGPVGEVRKLAGDLKFTEGPADDGHGNLYYSDIPANRIYKIDAQGKNEVFLEPSNHTNGLMINRDGNIVAAEMDGRIVEIDVKTKKVTPLAAEYNGKRFNAPNDVVIDSTGGVYFTDPRFRAPEPWPQGKEAWYYVDTKGKVTRLGDDLPAPNGVILSPDEKTLYVIPSMQKQMMAYPVEAPGKLGKGKVFCDLRQSSPTKNGGGDGLTIDEKGNLYITSELGLQVFSPDGKHLGNIAFPEQPANATFGGKGNKTLYVTARTGVYAVDMEVAGHRFATKK
jgi:gluconolactonase